MFRTPGDTEMCSNWSNMDDIHSIRPELLNEKQSNDTNDVCYLHNDRKKKNSRIVYLIDGL